MSQQRVLVAVCLLGAVVLVSAQSFDFDTCQKAVRSQLDEYSKNLRGAAQNFANSMQSTADSAADLSAFDSDIDKLTNSFNELMSGGTNFDASRLSSIYLQNMQTMSSLMRTAFSMYMKMPQAAMSSYMEFGQSVMSAQSKLMQSMTNSCMPRTKSSSSQ